MPNDNPPALCRSNHTDGLCWLQVFILLIITFGVIVGAIATASVITKCG